MSYRVYFGRLPDSLSQDDFEKLLSEHGKAKNIEWKSGYAYVDYKHGSDAAKTVANLNGKEIEGNNILVELARNGGAGGYSVAGGFSLAKPLSRPVRTPHRVRIENLSTRAKWMELKELLSMAGEVTFADTHKRKQGEGIVEFRSRGDMKEAIHMFDKTVFFGKTIRIYDESPRYEPRNRNSRSPHRRPSPSHRRSSPRPKEKRKSRSRSKSGDRKLSRSETNKTTRPKSASPRRKPKQKHSKSPSSSPDRRKSKKRHGRSMSPPKHARHSRKTSRRSRSKSPDRSKKHEKHKRSKKDKRSSSSDSDNKDGPKRKSKTYQKRKASSSESDSASSSNESSGSDKK